MVCGECGNVTAPGAGFPNHVYCKRFLLRMEKREDASRCRDFIPKPLTNADRIRALTDEELESIIMKYVDCNLCRVERGHCDKDYAECKGAWLDWLRQEANT